MLSRPPHLPKAFWSRPVLPFLQRELLRDVTGVGSRMMPSSASSMGRTEELRQTAMSMLQDFESPIRSEASAPVFTTPLSSALSGGSARRMKRQVRRPPSCSNCSLQLRGSNTFEGVYCPLCGNQLTVGGQQAQRAWPWAPNNGQLHNALSPRTTLEVRGSPAAMVVCSFFLSLSRGGRNCPHTCSRLA